MTQLYVAIWRQQPINYDELHLHFLTFQMAISLQPCNFPSIHGSFPGSQMETYHTTIVDICLDKCIEHLAEPSVSTFAEASHLFGIALQCMKNIELLMIKLSDMFPSLISPHLLQIDMPMWLDNSSIYAYDVYMLQMELQTAAAMIQDDCKLSDILDILTCAKSTLCAIQNKISTFQQNQCAIEMWNHGLYMTSLLWIHSKI